MAAPPLSHTENSWCFSFAGVDYSEPDLLQNGQTLDQRYGCMFKCLQTQDFDSEDAFILKSDSLLMAVAGITGSLRTPRESEKRRQKITKYFRYVSEVETGTISVKHRNWRLPFGHLVGVWKLVIR